ncbi:hypothetical protein FB567DRAFT_16442 [Paraphoma chrysanthemicola]|uniref:Uncharacterized protein n=1 Tax=Paraphoma chrysanthemicola TaxID=798071 RepID=A0A8K0RJG1_9PLEO|nr:hypothetical protein FB567DRAFT_16442 [Paraphoma chrysanthemicola]
MSTVHRRITRYLPLRTSEGRKKWDRPVWSNPIIRLKYKERAATRSPEAKDHGAQSSAERSGAGRRHRSVACLTPAAGLHLAWLWASPRRESVRKTPTIARRGELRGCRAFPPQAFCAEFLPLSWSHDSRKMSKKAQGSNDSSISRHGYLGRNIRPFPPNTPRPDTWRRDSVSAGTSPLPW